MEKNRLLPSEGQLKFLDWEFGVFFHFGIRSFYMGHRDWDNREMPVSGFMPEHLDCEQWIRTIKEAGAEYAVLVCKHHDGFANWPSKYSDYSVKYVPWKDGKGDVVAEYIAACRKYDIKVGLYYSPAQWGGKVSFQNESEYDDYFINQIGELLTNYGKIDYLWFDGCGSDRHNYDKPRIIKAIRSMQPEILIFGMWDPDTRWVGNEDGYASIPNPYICKHHDLDSEAFLPVECDCMMRDTWFDCEENEDKIKSVDELMGIYELSVGRGGNMLLNIGPDSRGRLPDEDTARILEFGEELRKVYDHPVEDFGAMQSKENGVEIVSEKGVPVNRIVLKEDITQGQHVRSFRIMAQTPHGGESAICIYQGQTIGHKHICVFPTILARAFRLEILDEDGKSTILDMKAHYRR